jgi:hypothetical protein
VSHITSTRLIVVTNAIHSVGAGASLLSAMGIGRSYTCVSTITWAASHYYRHLFGLKPLHSPSTLGSRTKARRPVNILWLSRAKLDAYAKQHSDWSQWRDLRHIENEVVLLARIRSGLEELCNGSGDVDCVYEDAQEFPETWTLTTPEESEDAPFPIRFASIDPTVHALETQINFVGHASILVASHGGALGLSLFLPPGDATLIELQVGMVNKNFHFEHMANEMGHGYEALRIQRRVDVDQVWAAILSWIHRQIESV